MAGLVKAGEGLIGHLARAWELAKKSRSGQRPVQDREGLPGVCGDQPRLLCDRT